jgi:sugar phosphate permease
MNLIFYGWFIVIGHMATLFFVTYAFIYSMSAFIGPITDDMGWSHAQFSFASSLHLFVWALSGPLIGVLVDKYGPRKIVLVGALTTALGMIIISTMNTLIVFYFGFFIISAGTAATVGIPFVVAVANWFKLLRGRAMGIMFAGPIIAGPLIPLLVKIIDQIGWRKTIAYGAIFSLLINIPAGIIARHRPEPYGYQPDGRVNSIDEQIDDPTIDTGMTTKEAFRSRSFWGLVLIFGFSEAAVIGMAVHQIPYFESVGFSRSAAASTFVFLTLFSGVGRIGTGWVMDYFDNRLVVLMLLIFGIIGLGILLFATDYWHAVLYAAFFGISMGGIISGRPVITAAYFAGYSYGSISGAQDFIGSFGAILAPVVLGWIFDITDSYALGVIFMIAMTIAGAFCVMLLPSYNHRKSQVSL